MKARDSGMPVEETWNSFFDPLEVFEHLGLRDPEGLVVDFGSGYGTFLIPAARQFPRSRIVGLDCEPEANTSCRDRLAQEGLSNATIVDRDLLADRSGLEPGSAKLVFLFNLLHAEDPVGLLADAHRSLQTGGQVAVIHWNHDPATPRGPRMDIRPRPEQVLAWATEAGFEVPPTVVPVARYHYGFTGRKPGIGNP